MDDTIADFVQVMEIDGVEEKALTAKITAKNDQIGLGNFQKSTEFCVTTEARTLPEDDESIRAPVDIVVALDVSGSMFGKKLELCKETLSFLLRELSSRDRFGLVTFGDESKLEFPTLEMTKKNKEKALSKIKGLCTNGCTNMSGGIGLAANELQSVASPHDVRSIFLLTDGHANRGISDKNGIVELTKGCLGGGEGQKQIAIHCFGYGSDHNQEMLNDISQATEGGTYYFVEQDCDVASAFGDALGGILSVVAQNVSVNIKVPDIGGALGVSILNVKHDKAVKQEDGSFRVDIGDFYAEESRDIIVETSLSSKAGEGNEVGVPHLEVCVSYLDTIKKKLIKDKPITKSIKRSDGDEISASNAHVALQILRVQTTLVISEAEKLAEANQLEVARKRISEFTKNLEHETNLLGESNHRLVVQFKTELNAIMASLASRNEYRMVGSKLMMTTKSAYAKQRCSKAWRPTEESDCDDFYRSKKKQALAMKFRKMGK
jgi:Mg-chelatase subunit ChlD